MAGDWIPMRLDLGEDPAVLAIADATGLSTIAVVGGLHRLWSWANAQSRDGHARSVTPARLDALVGVTGFAQAMIDQGWLSASEQGVTFSNFDRWNTQPAKRRILAAQRKRLERSRSERDGSVTREEKRREENKRTPLTPLRGVGVTIPAELDTPEFRAAWGGWKANRAARKHKPYTVVGEERQLKHLAKFGPKAALAAIEEATRQGWQGLFPEKHRDAAAARSGPGVGRVGRAPAAPGKYDHLDGEGPPQTGGAAGAGAGGPAGPGP